MSGLLANKVLGALLASALGFIVINKFSNVVLHPDVPEPEKFAYSLAAEAPSHTIETVEIVFPSPAWLEARDVDKGAKVFKKCKSCHTATSDGKSGTGPALWNIVGRSMGSVAGFSYSDAMNAKGGVWGYEELDAFLTKPKDYISKTKMSFNGLKKETDRAALIEYLRQAADVPLQQLNVAVNTADTLEEIVQEVVEVAPEQLLEKIPEKIPEKTPEEMAGGIIKEAIPVEVPVEKAPVEGGH